MSISEAKCKVTATEYLGWLSKINEDEGVKWDKHDKWEYYLSSVCFRLDALLHVVANLFSKSPNKYNSRAEDFLLKFTVTDGSTPAKPEPAEAEIVAWSRDGRPMTQKDVDAVNRSKAAWMGSLGLTTKGKSKGEEKGEPIKGKKVKTAVLPPHVRKATEAAKKRKAEKK